ncbi:MAG TPA: transcription antitermination factor NusB [Virgibacillus sp.]|nr:transcription antitermination factor NusB [Virgibacillus sp.]
MNRHEARKLAFQILFQIDINDIEPAQAMEAYLETNDIDPFIQTLVTGVGANKYQIDETIKSHLENWSYDRIASVEKTILRLSVYEMQYLDDIPVNVSINEAVELAHIFADGQSGKFVNGVLSKLIV